MNAFESQVINFPNTSITRGSFERQRRAWSIFKTLFLSEFPGGLIELYSNPNRLYQRLAESYYSLGYVNIIIRSLNKYVEFQNLRSGMQFFSKFGMPNGSMRALIQKSNKLNKTGKAHAVAPLTEELLYSLKSQMKRSHWHYLHVSLWLGLRPSEIDLILQSTPETLPMIMKEAQLENGIHVIKIYQSKLASKCQTEDKCWKLIPLLTSQQFASVQFLKERSIQKPHLVTLQRRFPSGGFYSGRKGFAALMIKNGWTMELISTSLGHANFKMTEAFYASKETILLSNLRSFKFNGTSNP